MFVLRMLTWSFKVLVAFPLTKSWAINVIDDWTWRPDQWLRYHVAADLQQKISQVTGHPICGYCYWVVWPEMAHDYCVSVLEESDELEDQRVGWQEDTESERDEWEDAGLDPDANPEDEYEDAGYQADADPDYGVHGETYVESMHMWHDPDWPEPGCVLCGIPIYAGDDD